MGNENHANSSNEKKEDIITRFERERREWLNKVEGLTEAIRDIYNCANALVDLLSQRQIALEYTHTLMSLLSKVNAQLREQRRDRYIYYTQNYDLKLDKDPKNMFIDVDLKKVVMMQGRYHFYEGHSLEKVVYPIKVMKRLGVKTLILTNAAGAINRSFKPADLMIITDHINFMGKNPLFGTNDDTLGTRFPDMSEVYKKYLVEIAETSAKEVGFEIKKCVYIACTGPSYETPAEVKMLSLLGADAVGMSTVPEAIIANYCGINVLGISCISNAAAGLQKTVLSHQEVIETTNLAKNKFQSLLLKVLEKI